MDKTIRETLESLEQTIKYLVPDPTYPDDPYVIITLEEAITAALEGNAGIGVVLVDQAGNVVMRDRNRMFKPYFRSDYHAEMVLLTAYEERYQNQTLKGYSLYSSLEPCEMCLIRIINSGVSQTYYVAPDEGKGGITARDLAPHWQNLAQTQQFEKAHCAPEFSQIALHVFELSLPGVIKKLQTRR